MGFLITFEGMRKPNMQGFLFQLLPQIKYDFRFGMYVALVAYITTGKLVEIDNNGKLNMKIHAKLF